MPTRQGIGGVELVLVPPGEFLMGAREGDNWQDADAIRILMQCAGCLTPGGRVLVVDSVMPPSPSSADMIQDLFLAVNFGAEARAQARFEFMLGQAGLKPIRCERLDDFYSLLEGERI